MKILLTLVLLLFSSLAYANDNYISFSYSDGTDSGFKPQQKEKQIMYGLEYGKKLSDHWWLGIEAVYSTHELNDVEKSFLIKGWSIYKIDIFYFGAGVGLSTYKDNVLVKKSPSSSLGLKFGLEYMLSENQSIAVEYKLEHNSGIWKDDRGRNIDLISIIFKKYF